MGQKTVLICDDDEGIVDVASIILRDAGFHVITLTQSLEVVAMVKRMQPNLILLDLWMPDLSGEELTQQLKADIETKHIPVIVVSASRDTEKVAQTAGATDYMKKPFDIDQLEEIVRKYA